MLPDQYSEIEDEGEQLLEKPARPLSKYEKFKLWMGPITNTWLAILFAFLMFKHPDGIPQLLGILPAALAVPLAGALFATFAVFELTNFVICCYELSKAWKEKKILEEFMNKLVVMVPGMVAQLAAAAGSTCIVLNSFVAAGLVGATVAPICFAVALSYLALKSFVEFYQVLSKDPSHMGFNSEGLLALGKGLAYMSLAICVGAGLIAGISTGTCMALGIALTLAIVLMIAIPALQKHMESNRAEAAAKASQAPRLGSGLSAIPTVKPTPEQTSQATATTGLRAGRDPGFFGKPNAQSPTTTFDPHLTFTSSTGSVGNGSGNKS